MSVSPSGQGAGFRIQLADLAAIVIGYALAAILFRAFWPSTGMSPVLGLFAAGFYLWLGLAMSGPLLMVRRKGQVATDDASGKPVSDPLPGRTWAELAWLLIGVYWIVIGALVLPLRLRSFRFGDTLLFGLVPLAAVLALRLYGVKAGAGTGEDQRAPGWTHMAAVALLFTWPFAWFCLIVLGTTLM